MPLSEEEQRILQELEQKLYEQDRAFVDRVRAESPGSMARRSLRWAGGAFIVGFAVVLVSFRSSLLLGTFGFLVMLFAALLFERSARVAYRAEPTRQHGEARGARRRGDLANALQRIRRLPRSRRSH
ncbi:MAG: DUF3040 domain-containing protein [Actinomycetota bacterium]|nr:DUF3040 domain-containing protein [Actinomycetota bacterium]